MSTTAEKLAYLSETKAQIRDAIVAKGVEVPETTVFRDYKDKIGAIETGVQLDPLNNPAAAENIYSGYEAYDQNGTKLTGSAQTYSQGYSDGYEAGSLRPELSNPAGPLQIHTGYQAYTYDGQVLDGQAPIQLPLSYTWDENALTLTITEVPNE